jgi:hypothetical protein
VGNKYHNNNLGTLKGQCHEIFDSPFFRQSITPRPQIDTLKYFRIRRDIRMHVKFDPAQCRIARDQKILQGSPAFEFLFCRLYVTKFAFERIFDRLFL